MKLEYGVACTVPGFENVTIIYNMMATEEEADKFVRTAGRECNSACVIRIEGWDADQYGPDPFDYSRSPIAFRVWAGRKGWPKAVDGFLNDPNS